MELSQITKAHFIGVGGIGTVAILRLFSARGIQISGSDMALPLKETLPPGDYHEGHDGAHVPTDANVVIYSAAVPESNPERVRARELGVTELSYPEALALVTKTHNTIAISGTHGKSTTTALIGTLFVAGNFDPSVIVGAEVPGWSEHNLRRGASDLFVVEACEYRRHMLALTPQTIVLTNIELDHPDYYRDLADVKNAFREYVGKLSGEDLLIINNDDANIRDIVSESDSIIVRYGVGSDADLVARNIKQAGGMQSFELTWKGSALGTFTTPLPGTYNIYNILAAVAAYLSYSGNHDVLNDTLASFHGVGRRFEIVGTQNIENHSTIIISDYAHHPTALRGVVEATAVRYPESRVLTIFRPHHRDRTLKLFEQFVKTFEQIPHAILLEIYDVPGREEGIPISSQDIIAKVRESNPSQDITFAPDLDTAASMAQARMHEFDIMLVVGAGDADKLAKKLVGN